MSSKRQKKDVVLSHLEFEDCVCFMLSSFSTVFQETTERGFMRGSPLTASFHIFPLKTSSKKAPFHRDQPENPPRKPVLIAHAHLQGWQLGSDPRIFYKKGSHLRRPGWLWRAARCVLLALTAIFWTKVVLPPGRGLSLVTAASGANLKINQGRAVKKSLLTAKKPVIDFTCYSKDALNDILRCCFLPMSSVFCLTHRSTSSQLITYYVPDAMLGDGVEISWIVSVLEKKKKT